MTTAPPIVHAITRNTTRRHLLGHLYSATCACGTPFPATDDRDGREARIRKHLEQVKRIDIKAAEMEHKRALALGQRQRAKARKAAAADA